MLNGTIGSLGSSVRSQGHGLEVELVFDLERRPEPVSPLTNAMQMTVLNVHSPDDSCYLLEWSTSDLKQV